MAGVKDFTSLGFELQVGHMQSVQRRTAIGQAFLLLSAAALWAVSLGAIDYRHMTDVGLISVLPPSFFIALFLLTISFCLIFRQEQFETPLPLIHLFVLILMLFGTTILVEEVPTYHVAWRHFGISEYFLRTGGLDHYLDAYFNWPTFFILSAFMTKVAGFESAINFARWSSIFFHLLYLGPVFLLLKSATSDKRLVWLGTWFFCIMFWAGNDYFLPQALNYFFYLVILAVLFRWFNVARVRPNFLESMWLNPRIPETIKIKILRLVSREDPSGLPGQSGQRVGLLAIIVLVYAVSVSSHMLTPFFTLASVIALVAFYRIAPRGLPILMAVLLLTWISFSAHVFLSGHMDMVTGTLGKISENVNDTVVNRVRGSPGHIFVVQIRIFMTIAIWGLAILGGIRRIRSGYWDLTFGLLTVVPFTLLIFQAYGGEMMLRVYLFSLLPIAFFAAALFFPRPTVEITWRSLVAIGLLSTGLLGGFLFTRYGNERADYFTKQELEAVRFVYGTAGKGSLLVAASHSLPWRLQDFEKFGYAVVRREVRNGDIGAIAHIMESARDAGAYLIITRSQKAELEMYYGIEPGELDRLEQEMKDSGRFSVIFENPDATVFGLSATPFH
jgi:hypothetical protein